MKNLLPQLNLERGREEAYLMNVFKIMIEIRKLKKICAENAKEIKKLDSYNDGTRNQLKREIIKIHKLRKQDSCKHEGERRFWHNTSRDGDNDIYFEECCICDKVLTYTYDRTEWEQHKFDYMINYHNEKLKRITEEHDESYLKEGE